MRMCARCEGPVEGRFRYCPWCAAPQRLKFTELFAGDRGKGLRVSRYLEERQVRFSVWDEAGRRMRASAAVSLDEDEAARLAQFLAETEAPTESLLLPPA